MIIRSVPAAREFQPQCQHTREVHRHGDDAHNHLARSKLRHDHSHTCQAKHSTHSKLVVTMACKRQVVARHACTYPRACGCTLSAVRRKQRRRAVSAPARRARQPPGLDQSACMQSPQGRRFHATALARNTPSCCASLCSCLQGSVCSSSHIRRVSVRQPDTARGPRRCYRTVNDIRHLNEPDSPVSLVNRSHVLGINA